MTKAVHDRYYIQIKKSHRGLILKRRKEFMDLLLKSIMEDEAAEEKLSLNFGVSVIAKTNEGSDVSLMVDGERIFKI